MDRRAFLKVVWQSGAMLSLFGISGCGRSPSGETRGGFAAATAPDTRVLLYDVYAMALYMEGDLGPRTGIIKVDYVLKNEPVRLEFWHGHDGMSHFFTVLPEHFAQLRKRKRVYIETTVVAGHTHKLFIDPVQPQWRVEGAKPVEVPDSRS